MLLHVQFINACNNNSDLLTESYTIKPHLYASTLIILPAIFFSTSRIKLLLKT